MAADPFLVVLLRHAQRNVEPMRLDDARAGKGRGSASRPRETFGRGGASRLRELAALEPFGRLIRNSIPGEGIVRATHGRMKLMGEWTLSSQASKSRRRQGTAIDNIGVSPLTAGCWRARAQARRACGITGFLRTKGAPKEPVAFCKV